MPELTKSIPGKLSPSQDLIKMGTSLSRRPERWVWRPGMLCQDIQTQSIRRQPEATAWFCGR